MVICINSTDLSLFLCLIIARAERCQGVKYAGLTPSAAFKGILFYEYYTTSFQWSIPSPRPPMPAQRWPRFRWMIWRGSNAMTSRLGNPPPVGLLVNCSEYIPPERFRIPVRSVHHKGASWSSKIASLGTRITIQSVAMDCGKSWAIWPS
jgi:hypothetical protein